MSSLSTLCGSEGHGAGMRRREIEQTIMHVQQIAGRLASAHQGTLSAGALSGIRLDCTILGYLHRSALEPLRNRVSSSFEALQMSHDLVGPLGQRPGGDPHASARSMRDCAVIPTP